MRNPDGDLTGVVISRTSQCVRHRVGDRLAVGNACLSDRVIPAAQLGDTVDDEAPAHSEIRVVAKQFGQDRQVHP